MEDKLLLLVKKDKELHLQFYLPTNQHHTLGHNGNFSHRRGGGG